MSSKRRSPKLVGPERMIYVAIPHRVNLILFANAIELFQIWLVVVTAAGRHFSIENDPTVGINCLMHFVFELPGRPLLLGERRIWIGTTAVRLIG
jgi:hypothetical protein